MLNQNFYYLHLCVLKKCSEKVILSLILYKSKSRLINKQLNFSKVVKIMAIKIDQLISPLPENWLKLTILSLL